MGVSGLDHLNLTVRDFAETVAWYGRVFRFVLVEEGLWEGIRWGILRSGEGRGPAMLCIYEHRDYRSPGQDALKDGRLHGIRHFGVRIGDEGEWRATLSRERLESEEMRWPHSTSWYVTDPTGYDIEVALWDGDRVAFGPAHRPGGAD